MSGTVKHTPGPWAPEEGRVRIEGKIKSADGRTVAQMVRSEDMPVIAAAPDMLVALRCARADCYMPPHVAAHVDAAIARAEGRS